MPTTVDILSQKLNEIIYDPYALLHKLDEETLNIVDKRDPNIPNIDTVLRRKVFMKSIQITNLFIYIENLYTQHKNNVKPYPSSNMVNVLEKISNIYTYQIYPEIKDLCIKFQPRNVAEYEHYEDENIAKK